MNPLRGSYRFRSKSLQQGLLTLAVVVLVSCSSLSSSVPPHYSSQEYNFNSLVFFHFQPYPSTSVSIVKCPITGLEISAGPIEGDAPEKINQMMKNSLREKIFIPLYTYKDEVKPLEHSPDSTAEVNYLEQNREKARSLQADAFLTGLVFRYQERKGKSWGVEYPASVAFTVVLVDVSTGRLLWRGKVDRIQRPASENLLEVRSLQQAFTWQRVDEMAREEIERLLQDFPVLKADN